MKKIKNATTTQKLKEEKINGKKSRDDTTRSCKDNS